MRKFTGFIVGCLIATSTRSQAITLAPMLAVRVDATDAARQVWHVKLHVSLDPSAAAADQNGRNDARADVALVYPKWIPGNHGPTGPIANLGSLRASCGGDAVTWKRDALDPYTVHFSVPARAATLDLTYDLFEGSDGKGDMTAQLAVLDWNQVVFYPQTARLDHLIVAPSIVLPTGWTAATALQPATTAHPFEPLAHDVTFAPVTLERLIDSPLYAGAHERIIPLVDADGMTSEVDLFGEVQSDVEPTAQQIVHWRNLVAQADALYGYRHWQHYHFLLTLSDAEAGRGLEHHESSANGLPERYLSDADVYEAGADLLPHEYTHSWNGKYRRPLGLIVPNDQAPMVDDDLYVYEGLTQYWGLVLAQRSGLAEPGTFEQTLAGYYAALDVEPGRLTRPLLDTARAQGLTREAQSRSGRFARRGEDYYTEGALMWLDADTLIRERTHGRRSLDDFARAFFGNGAATPPVVIGYTRNDIIAALNGVLPYDWSAFLRTRVDEVAVHPPHDAISRGGWHLTFMPEPTDFQIRRERLNEELDATYSLGAVIRFDGTIDFTIDTLPLGRAGVAAGSKILAVNDQEFSPDRLRLALAAARTSTAPIRLIVDDMGVIERFAIDDHGGERYPQLVRDPDRSDILAQIGAPRPIGSGR